MRLKRFRTAAFALAFLAAPVVFAAIPDAEGADVAPAPPSVSRENRAPRPARTPRPRGKRRKAPPAADSRRPEAPVALTGPVSGTPAG